MAEHHLPSERLARYQAERARGGVGLIVFEASSVHPTADIFGTSVHAFDTRAVPGFQRVADAVHEHGARILVQLFHSGVHTSFHKTFMPAWGPSPVPSIVDHEVPHVMDEDDIQEIVAGFAASTANAVEGGMDGVEVHFGHSYLLHQFLSPAYNRRADRYGGSLENRLRFPLHVLERVRAAAGTDHVVGIRVSAEDMIPGGLSADQMREIVREVVGTGLVDYVSVSIGSHHTRHMMVPPMAIKAGYQLPLAHGIKEAVPYVPVQCVGRITSPELADSIVAEGIADLVGMTRAQIADPELVEKARTGRTGEIRYCIGSNQGCRGLFFLGRPISCTVNPAAGFEQELNGLQPAQKSCKVLVAGGGPAGLKVAEVAAKRGHEVTLCERGDVLGGQVNLAARLPLRADFGALTQHLEGELRRLRVEILVGCEVDEEFVHERAPDVVVVATGATPLRTGFAGVELDGDRLAGADLPHVAVAEDVLGGADVGRRVVVLDEDRGYKAMGVAELLADQGREVHVLSSAAVMGSDLLPTGDLQLAYPRLMGKGVRFTPLAVVEEILPTRVRARHAYSREPIEIEDVDGVVLITGGVANDGLYHLLKGKVDALHCIGDALAPRRVDAAVLEGDRLGRAL